ncbi:MAG TPA: DUF2782 domain-containing protein [Candidatus Tenderia electrophaga]|uniref:DUF2782 domain-containing protein n=1 Tax=Candidatus Tenderia electrophaga TaxID=1748243 RepID=A0A832N3V9_9GAMM|nr:DUF2782 domain-containing protein [Candidatus Tenderia electrophaga]
MMKLVQIFVAMLLLSAFSAKAETGASVGQTMEPEVVITPKEQGRVREYRNNGRLYMIEVIPAKGAPYYLIDSDGDGLLERRQNELGPDFMIPKWSILRW